MTNVINMPVKKDKSIIDLDAWIDMVGNDKYITMYDDTLWCRMDVELAKHLSSYFTGYMTGPVAAFKGIAVPAKTRQFEATIEGYRKMKESLDELSKHDDVFLYQLVYFPKRLVYTEIDDETGATVYLTEPKFSNAVWKLRYGTLNEDSTLPRD